MEISYTLRMPQPDNHYFEVEMEVKNAPSKQTTLKMATWTPGSYLIREYARNVETVIAKDASGKEIAVTKTAKNVWQVANNGSKAFKIAYRVYANELTVRNCYLDAEQGYLNGAAVFLYVKGAENQRATLHVDLPKAWTKVITALEPRGNTGVDFDIENIDELFDSPILCGNPTVISFTAAGVPHRVAFQGFGTWKEQKIKDDFTKIVEAEKAVFQHHPCKSYTFIIHHMPNAGGGLEHLNSTCIQTAANAYDNETNYANLLGLVAHEYFHLWNVKRLRPKPLGPFDYDNENYSTLLWFAEGFTSYYDDFFVYRAGLIKKERFLDVVGSNISRIESVPGMYVQSLSESSLDAWIKYYRPNENSANSQGDYYTKGGGMALVLDLMLIKESKGTYSLDNLMKDLYNEYYLKRNTWFTEEDLEKELVKHIGKSAGTFFDKYINGLERPDWAGLLADFGIKLVDRNEAAQPNFIGLKLQGTGKATVQSISKNGPAYLSGIYVGDEIISIGDRRVEGADLAPYLAGIKAGSKVEVVFARAGQMRSAVIEIVKDPGRSYRLDWIENATAEQDMLRKKWLRL